MIKLYIVFEGTNGVGKSTLIPLVIEKLKQKMIKENITPPGFHTFHEGDTVKNPDKLGYLEQVFAYALDRATKFKELDSNDDDIIIGDRSFYSSIVYQSRSVDRKESMEWVRTINNKFRKPDIIIYIRKEPDIYQKLYDKIIPVGETIVVDRTSDEFKDMTPDELADILIDQLFLKWLKDTYHRSYYY